jgi:leader peptidase (prepilin peptidase)/N-methyltransferase
MILSAATLGLGAITGMVLGSFAVTAGLRMSRGDSALTGRSRCDGCGCALSFAQTVPLVSYVRLGGACAGCGGRIDPTHLAGEAAGGLMVVAGLFVADPARSLLLSALGLTLIAAAAVDLKVHRLPDVLTASVAALGFWLSALRGGDAVIEGVVAAGLTASALLLLRAVSRRLRTDPGLGLGDVKLFAALALWLGASTPWLVACAAGVGLAIMRLTRPADGRLAFGPAIAVAAWAVGFSQEAGLWPTTM